MTSINEKKVNKCHFVNIFKSIRIYGVFKQISGGNLSRLAGMKIDFLM